ncbi:YesL family protein [Microbacterium sp. NPDC056044]|uniref:YesL family protein n=1 Tax=Microbacterium sp. NPDC056044 TaxID=3345690 RepID=UPI0035D76914
MIAEYGWTGRVMAWLRVVAALIVVNLLFVAGTLVGLVVLGLAPAALAATACLTRLRDGEGDTGLVREFAAVYRAGFWRANLIGLPFGIVAVLLVADTAVLPVLDGVAAAALAGFTWVAGAVAALVFACALTVAVRYDETAGAVLRYAAVLLFTSPMMSVVMLVSLGAVGAALALLPMLVPLAGFAVLLFVAGWFVDHRLAALDPDHPRAGDRRREPVPVAGASVTR